MPSNTLTKQEQQLLLELASGIVKRRLTAPAIFFLESMKPLSFVGSQAMIFFRPIIQTLWSNPEKYDQITTLLSRRGTIEIFLSYLEKEEQAL